MNRRPILGLTLTFLVAATLVTPAAVVTPRVGTEAANSQSKSKPNDAFVDVPDFVFGDGESLASLKLHYLTLGTPREWRNHQWGSAASRHRGIGCRPRSGRFLRRALRRRGPARPEPLFSCYP
jgi:hypothetical protein